MPSKHSFTVLFSALRLRSQKWMDVQVGDIIKLENNQFVTVSHGNQLDYSLFCFCFFFSNVFSVAC